MFKNKRGFTLIELMVVISIIGILSTVALTSFNGARRKARDVIRKAHLHDMYLAIEEFHIDNNTYIVPGTGWNGCSCGWFNYEGGASYIKSIAHGLEESGYFTEAPRDPSLSSDNSTPQYMKYQCGPGFFVYARLESPSAEDLAAYEHSKSIGCANLDVYGMNYAVGHRE